MRTFIKNKIQHETLNIYKKYLYSTGVNILSSRDTEASQTVPIFKNRCCEYKNKNKSSNRGMGSNLPAVAVATRGWSSVSQLDSWDWEALCFTEQRLPT